MSEPELAYLEAFARKGEAIQPAESLPLLAEVRRLQALDQAMIDKLGEMTERAYRAEVERDEAREAAGRLFRGTAHSQSSGLRKALTAAYPWLTDREEKEAAP